MKKKYLKAYIEYLEKKIANVRLENRNLENTILEMKSNEKLKEEVKFVPHDEIMSFMCYKCKKDVTELHHNNGAFECICHECRSKEREFELTFEEVLLPKIIDSQ